MKKLSIEEKAKAYDEAKARMSRAFNSNRCTLGFMNEIFPELKESEDEKIRKEIISFIKDDINEINLKMSGDYDDRDDDDIAHQNWCKKAIAWLEKKQNSNVDNANKEYWRGYREGKQEILDKYAELEKQGELKPWSEEDEEYCQCLIKDIENSDPLPTSIYSDCKKWLKSLKDRIQPQSKQEWSEEEQVSEEFINALGTMLNDGLPDRYLVSEERIKKSAELLFSIARKQLKNEMQEWSEEVDLEKEAEDFVQTGEFVKNENPVLAIAKHFYELGLKTQKGE